MKTSLPDKGHPLYARAVKRAEVILRMPREEIVKKLAKARWEEDRLPTAEEFAPYIIRWVEEENIRRGF